MKVRFKKQIARGNKSFKAGEVYEISDSVAKNYLQRGLVVPAEQPKNEVPATPRKTKEHKEAVKSAQATSEKVVEPKSEDKPKKKPGRPRKKKS